jgi:hypothetical protein
MRRPWRVSSDEICDARLRKRVLYADQHWQILTVLFGQNPFAAGEHRRITSIKARQGRCWEQRVCISAGRAVANPDVIREAKRTA